jgi:hypothetical protein
MAADPDRSFTLPQVAAVADVEYRILADNYGEAGALQLFGRRLPPVASAAVTMRYWRPQAAGRRALVVGYSRDAAHFCSGYRVLTRISSADDSDEGGQPIARCTLRGTLARVWPSIVTTHQN